MNQEKDNYSKANENKPELSEKQKAMVNVISNNYISFLENTNRLDNEVTAIDNEFIENVVRENHEDKVLQIANDTDLCESVASYRMGMHDSAKEFIHKLIEKENPEYILDPFVLKSSIIYEMGRKVKGYCHFKKEFNVLGQYRQKDNIQLLYGTSLDLLTNEKPEFDAIISMPLTGRHKDFREFIDAENGVKMLLKSLDCVKDNGKVIMFLKSDTLFSKETKDQIKSKGFKFDAIINSPELNRPGFYLVILSKIGENNSDACFIAQFSKENAHNNQIYINFISEKQSKDIKKGYSVNSDEFFSWKGLENQFELKRLGKRTGFKAVKLKDIAKIEKNDSRNIEDRDWDNNSQPFIYDFLFVPEQPNKRITNNPANFEDSFDEYFKLSFDTSQYSPDYIVEYFNNSKLGELGLSSCLQDGYYKNISKDTLSECLVYFPDIKLQNYCFEINKKIDYWEGIISEMHHDLWAKPLSTDKVDNKLTNIEETENLEAWIEKLPFPLSSILWWYISVQNKEKKIEHGIHFFEAFSEFLVLITLSGFSSDKDFFNKHKKKWFKKNNEGNPFWETATMGTWTHILSVTAKKIRTLESDDKPKLYELFKNPDPQFIEILKDKDIVRILNDMRIYRNEWIGHSGIVSDEYIHERQIMLDKKLYELKKMIGFGFSHIKIIAPREGIFEDGIFNCKVLDLIGTRTPFKEIYISSSVVLDNKKLYLFNENQLTPIELLPFMRIEQNVGACYFYNRIENNNIRWVSFNYKEKGEYREEIDKHFEELVKLIK